MRFSVPLLVLLATLPAVQAIASGNVPVPLEDYERTVLNPELGAPASAIEMVQSPGGFLWFSTTDGLYRSDGVSFERLDIPGLRSSGGFATFNLTPDTEGGLWLSGNGGGTVHVKDGRITEYGEREGLPANKAVRNVVQAGDTTLAGTLAGVFELRGNRWVQVPPMPELADKPIERAATDSKGRVWFVSGGAAYYGKWGGASYRRVPLPVNSDLTHGLLNGPDGSVWYWRHGGEQDNLCRLFPESRSACWHVSEIHTPVFEPDGTLWGLRKGRVFRLTGATAMSGADPEEVNRRAQFLDLKVATLARSRDGSLWAMSSENVTRLRAPAMRPARTPSGGLAAGTNGDLWLISYSRGLMRIGPVGATPGLHVGEDGTLWSPASLKDRDPSPYLPFDGVVDPAESVVLERYQSGLFSGFRITSDESSGDVYVNRMSPAGLVRLSGGKPEDVPLPPLEAGAAVRGVQRDRSGKLWISVSSNRVPLYRREGNQWHPVTLPITPAVVPGSLAIDRDDTLWLATRQHGILAMQGGRLREYGPHQGIRIGQVYGVFPIGGQVWASGSEGLFLRTADTFFPLVGVDDEVFAGVTGLVQIANGDAWFAGEGGIFRIEAREWRSVLDDPRHRVRYLRLGRLDGITSQAAKGPYPSAAQTTDGTLWFAMQGGLYPVDPRRYARRAPAPRVVPTRIAIDETPWNAAGALELSPDARRLSIGYQTPGAIRGERTRFRYRLTRDGQQGEWLDQGNRRQLFLDRIPHGRYVLELAASDREGYWSGPVSTLVFRVLPAFYQTWWFRALLALAVLCLAVLLYRVRTRQLAARIRGEMNARLRERERIARDLHDTLLQSMQGLVLSFQAIATKLPAHDPLHERMTKVLARTQALIREGRDRVHLLRDPEAGTLDLPECLQVHARDLAEEHGMLCEVDVPHPPRPLAPLVYDELRQMGREAITNAFLHSRGERVVVAVTYTDFGVMLKVQDDGIGMPGNGVKTEGHWGLQGMRERAQAIGATLSIGKAEPQGTDLKVFVPADKAYPSAKKPSSRMAEVIS
ncbi:histidine kinase [Lysobacter sp. CCNWLW3]|uniref:sensor histidine kinase n=1 Tax=unclassified Lysobacter TaxID=2635362 RepID=UPI002FD74DA7